MGLGLRKAPGIDQPAGKLGQDQGGGGGGDQGHNGHHDPPPIGPQEGQERPQGGQGLGFGPAGRHPGGFAW